MKETLKDSLTSLRHKLYQWSEKTLQYLKQELEVESGRTLPPNEWMQILLRSERYQWIHQVNRLVVDIDLLVEGESITPHDLRALKTFFDEFWEGDFEKNLSAVMLRHPEMKELVEGVKTEGEMLEVGAPLSVTEALKSRAQWFEQATEASKKRRN